MEVRQNVEGVSLSAGPECGWSGEGGTLITSAVPTAAQLRRATVSQLGTWAKKFGIANWRSMKKAQLVTSVLKAAKRRANAAAKGAGKTASSRTSKRNGQATARPKVKGQTARATTTKATVPARRAASAAPQTRRARRSGTGAVRSARSSNHAAHVAGPATTRKIEKVDPEAAKKLQELLAARERQMDLSSSSTVKPEKSDASATRSQDRIVLLVRDAYWLQATWDISRSSVERARAAMAELWHTAKPVLRVYEVDSDATTSTAERVERDIEIHGGVRNWYIDVKNPPRRFRVEIGYLASNGRFHCLARSNIVTTPVPGLAETVDAHWGDAREDFERIYSLSGGYADEHVSGELQHVFEDRLQRPVGSPSSSRYGLGTDRLLPTGRDFDFEIDVEALIYGRTKPNTRVTISGEPVKLRDDGTFVVRLNVPDRRQVLPLVASTPDGSEQRTIVLAIERNTKVMEPIVHETTD